jgi:hypothetical protein
MGNKSRSGSGMDIPDHISETLETICWVKILKFFDADPDPGSGNLFDLGSGMEKIQIRDKHPRFATLPNLYIFFITRSGEKVRIYRTRCRT